VRLNPDQVVALAPDAVSLRAGQGLASERSWSGVGQDERALWGLCQGSGTKPYQTQVDLDGPVFACTPEQFPPLIAVAIDGRDIDLWAAGQGIAGARGQ
jgi:hypothetical protein